MNAIHQEEGVADGAERSLQERSTDLSATLETHIERIEGALASADEGSWSHSVIALGDAARAAGADRIMYTVSLLLSADPSDARDLPRLLDRLRSDSRVYALEQICSRKEKALADELAARKPMIERGRA